MRNTHDPKRECLAPQSIIDQLSYDFATGIITSETLRFSVTRNRTGHKYIYFGQVQYNYARLIFQILGINITGLVIHHINHDESDNRFVNLQPMSNSAHVKLHMFIRVHVRDFDPDYWKRLETYSRRTKQFSLPLFVKNNEQVSSAAAGLSRPAAAQAAKPRKLKTNNLKQSNSLPGYRPASVASE